jgi:hypothetical protein
MERAASVLNLVHLGHHDEPADGSTASVTRASGLSVFPPPQLVLIS